MRNAVLADWIEWMQAQSWAATTIEDRVQLVERLARTYAVEPVDLQLEHVRAFLAGATFGRSSRRLYWTQLRCWFGWLVTEGHRTDDPTTSLPKPKPGRRRVRVLTTAHVERLLQTNMRQRTRAMILLAAYQGLRAGEVARVAGRDVDELGHLLAVLGKGDVDDYLPLHPRIAELAQDFGRGYWFPGTEAGHMRANSVSDVIGDVMKRAGVPGTAHSLRHWYATELLRQGVDIRRIQRLLRHASLATTEKYLHLDDDGDMDAVLRLPVLEVETRSRPRIAA